MKKKSFMGLVIVATISILICLFGFMRLQAQVKTTNQTDASVEVATSSSSEDQVKLKSYTVQKGDTLASVAEICKLSINELAKLNDISVTKVLKPGQKIKVPADQYDKLMKSHEKDSTSSESSTESSADLTESTETISSAEVMASSEEVPAYSAESVYTEPSVDVANSTPESAAVEGTPEATPAVQAQ